MNNHKPTELPLTLLALLMLSVPLLTALLVALLGEMK
jgi:hypothetical protein